MIKPSYSSRGLVYGIDSAGDEDEPLYLFVDDKMSDGVIILKYIPDYDEIGKFEPELPVKRETIQKSTKRTILS